MMRCSQFLPRRKLLRTGIGAVWQALKKRKNQRNRRRPGVGASVRQSKRQQVKHRPGRSTGGKLLFQESALNRRQTPDGRRPSKKIVWRLPRKRLRNWRASAMGCQRSLVRPSSRTGARRLKRFFRQYRSRQRKNR